MSAVAKEEIPDNHFVYRNIRFSSWSKQNKRRPQEACFSPVPDGLSVNWEHHCTLEEVFVIIGTAKNVVTGRYKDFREFRAIKFEVGEVKNLELVEPANIDVIHNPQPDNYSHSLVCYDEHNEEIRVKLSDIVEAKYDLIVFSPPNQAAIQTQIEERRKTQAEAFLDYGPPEEKLDKSPDQ
jgi:hypothetical protein